MSAAFEDDVEPLDEPLSRGRVGQNQSGNATASGSRIPTPEPDEDLDVTDGKQNMWLVKVPRFLIEGWTKVDEVDKRLGTVRVYDADHKGYQRMELHLPQEPEPAFPLPPSHPYLQTHYPRTFDMRLTSEQNGVRVRNLYAFKERLEGGDEDDDDDDDDLDSGAEDSKGKGRAGSASLQGRRKGRRLVAMVGKIANEASVKPQVATPIMRIGGGAAAGITPEYRAVLRKRRMEAQKPKRSVKTLDESDKARTNMLASGVSAHTSKNPKTSFIAGVGAPVNTGRKQPGTTTERFARLPRNELLDMLFELYDQFPYWSIKGLRSRVQQPEVYLREVLQSIANLHSRGPYAGNWSLKPEYLEMRKQQERENQSNAAASAALAGPIGTASTEPSSSIGGPSQQNAAGDGDAKVKEEEGDDEDDEEDMEMEDVE
ncbi:uncharacterized protein FA14DRAFT_160368 [Meira miltonrushii]|uniref:Transcription initiation factor IIF subunit beta n=1 Tax=Meira miltonrushii TaxID=1280837 RepID=A0A316VCJ4_9BASI|nr:uncharacterized protein FA14DRAFT_160368 [Meira miltonrushii]PWN35024.1 hypothetical protein FA14DRAFT_160368 [Meira miltonrushii]